MQSINIDPVKTDCTRPKHIYHYGNVLFNMYVSFPVISKKFPGNVVYCIRTEETVFNLLNERQSMTSMAF